MRDDAMNERDELDAMLDVALETYVDTKATPGLSHRILAVTSRREVRLSAVRWLPLAASALAAAILIAILLKYRGDSPSKTVPVAITATSSASVAGVPVRGKPAAHSVKVRAIKAPPNVQAQSPLPRLEVFPTPTPLSPEEQALVALVNRDSRDSKELAQQITRPDLQGQPIEPLRIAAIHIPPLNPPDNGSN